MTSADLNDTLTDRWLSLVAGALVLAVVGVTIVVWITAPSGPARFTLTATAEEERVEVDILNTGGTVATDVVIRATFADGTETDQTLSWISPGETTQLIFLSPAPDTPVDVAVVSYVPDD